MRCQLVLQFRGDTLEDFDQMIDLENELVSQLGKLIAVDGHDMGSDECNIFMRTADPIQAFTGISEVLERRQLLEAVVAAYRTIGRRDYTVIWPRNSTDEFTVG